MEVGDLVRPVRPGSKTGAPIVEEGWVGVIIDFTGDYYSPISEMIAKGSQPIVYWNSELHSEIEFPDQIEVVQCKNV